MSKRIITVCGDIQPEDLGFTSMHEHILSDCSMMRHRVQRKRTVFEADLRNVQPEDKLTLNNRSYLRHNITHSIDNMRLDDPEVMAAEIADFKERGGSAIVEVSAPGIRSTPEDVRRIRRIAEQTGVHIIASTGLYAEYTWPEAYRMLSRQQYVQYLTSEILNGIGGTGILPGHIKAAYEVYSEQLETYLEAASYVSCESGLSLQVHLGPYLTADEVQRNVVKPLLRGGCIPERTILCHVQLLMGLLELNTLILEPGRIPLDLTLHRQLLNQGFVLSFTPFGFEADDEPLGMAQYADWYILSGLVTLINEGYASQLVIGNDVFTKLATRRGGGEGYTRLTDFVVPVLRHCGIAEAEITKMTVENPVRILAV